MPVYQVKLLSKREVARNTFLFIFEKPADFTFIPGQYGGFTLIDPPIKDANGITRRFSLLSSPDDNYLSLVTRIQTSAYKKVLNAMTIGSLIKFAGPSGQFILHTDNTIPAIFIAGGIGITPFYSMLRYISTHQLPYKIILFYGNQSLEDAPLLPELEEIQKMNSNFKMVLTLNSPPTKWQGEIGFITRDMIRKYTQDYSNANYYVCGSPVMVTALQETLVEMNIPPDAIKVEDFPGYR